MKKITFILLALIAGTAFGQDASATATVNAHIVEVITIQEGTDLNFGNIVASTGGAVRVNTEGTRTFSNPDMKVANTGTVSAASFEVTAAEFFSYSISIPSIVLNGPETSTMDVSFTSEIDGNTDGIAEGTGAPQTLNVGGLLTVASGQVSGDYTGEVTVTVAYE
ncbi:DUF4402 domain-containing protein [Salinimicrobium xinjiangense]|uniref:DUF4402 domain-containing protein n=1 Tax=Salinimicrobium xinjiangense TaxID=438596 RepID=UPI0004259003|nr:DUF4402 domain-containing protein [Salinimicrobium xinjiangense]